MVSIVIPVLSERLSARRCLEAAVSSCSAGCEIVLVDGGISGLASQLVANTPGLRDRVRSLRCTSQRRLWTLFRQGLDECHGKYVVFTSIHEWLEANALSSLAEEMDQLGVDLLQARKVKRIRRIPLKEQTADIIPLHTAISGPDFRELVELSGDQRLITPCFTDKMWKTDLIRETLRLNFDGSWGTGEILNFHYLRHARSMAFTDTVITNYLWASPVPSYSFRRIDDIKKVYQIKMLASQGHDGGLRIELRNHLIAYVQNLIFKLGWTREAAVYYLRPSMEDRFWQTNGITDTIDEIVDEATRNHKRNTLTNILKQLSV